MKILKNTITTLFAMMALMIAIQSNATELKMKTFQMQGVKCSVEENQQLNHASTCEIFNPIFQGRKNR